MIDSLKDLEKLLKLCRKSGVTEIKLGTVELKLGDLPQTTASGANIVADVNVNPYENFPDTMLTPEQLMFYSSGGLPENDPVLSKQGDMQ